MNDFSFGLHERPFSAAPVTAAWFPANSQEQARRQLQRCVERAEGAGVVIAAAGIGKSLLLQVLAEQFRDRFHIAHLAGAAICRRKALLQNILFELGLPYRGLQEGELRLSLLDHLQPSRQCPHGMLLLIDEAHTLPLRLLEELRLLTNLVREGSPRVRMVLAGSRTLEERLANPKLDSFQQRIAVRAYLQPWTSQETAAYIRQEISRCGGKGDAVFTSDAARAIHLAAAGIPRLVNQIADHALTMASAAGRTTIDAAAIQSAWGDLQQLPAPWIEPVVSTASIEFGALDEVLDAAHDEALDEAEAEPVSEDWNNSAADPQEIAVEAEPVVPTAAELFGEDFDDELIVVDRLPPPVEVNDGNILPLPPPVLKIVDVAEEPAQRKTQHAAGPLASHVAARTLAVAQAEADESFDPVYPEVEPTTVGRSTAPSDKVVAIDQAHSNAPEPHVVKAPLGRFRNLFGTLRAKKD